MRVALAMLAGALFAVSFPQWAAWASYALAAVAGAAFGRAHRPSERDAPAPRPLALLAIALLVCLRADSRAPPAIDHGREFTGVWNAGAASGASEFGVLRADDGCERRVEIPRGALRDCERARFEPASEPSRSARGPVPAAREPRPTWSARADELVRLEEPPLWRRALAPFDDLRTAVLARCAQLGDHEASALAAAVLVGETGALSAETSDLFTRTGLRHVLAVSGMHVALLAALIWWPAGGAARIRGRRAAFAIALAQAGLLTSYVLIAGNGAPVRRASLALSLALLARAFVVGAERTPRRPDALSLTSFAFCAEIAIDPRQITSLSLTLSYGATLGLIAGTAPIARLLREALGLASSTATPRLKPRSALGAAAIRCASGTCSAVGASIAAVLATLPLCWTSFGEWSPIGVVATPLSLPLFAWLLGYGWLWVAFPSWLPSSAFETPAHWLLRLLELADALPATPVALPPRPLELLCVACVLVFVALRSSRWRAVSVRLAGGLWCALLLPWRAAPAGLEVVALDVGHGTAVALRAPGPEVWLFDAGSKDRTHVVSQALAPLLADWDASSLNVVLSHTDRDHAGALPWLVERYRVLTWAGALPAQLAERLPHSARILDVERGHALVSAASGGRTRLSLMRGEPAEGNEGSRSLLVETPRARVVLFGDGVEEGLEPLLDWLPAAAPVDLLLWPHHGAESRLLGRLLQRARPHAVWLSASAQAPVERELARRGLPVRSTARDGPLTWSEEDARGHGSR